MITLDHVTKSFASPVLRDISVTIPPSCIYGLIGPGASGKSVLVKILAGLVRPDGGHVIVDGRDIFEMPDIELQKFRLRFGMLFQNNALFDYMNVADNIAFPLRRMTALNEAEIVERIADRLKVVQLPGFEDRMPGGLSGGQKKRIGFARATVTQADVQLLDEPAAGLDPVTSQRIFDLIRAEQREKSSTVVVVSSDLDRLLTVTDRVGMLYKGRLIFDGTTLEAQKSENPYVKQFVHGLTEGPLLSRRCRQEVEKRKCREPAETYSITGELR